MPEWRPQDQAGYIKAEAKARRVKEAGGTRAKLPFFKLYRTAGFTWPTGAAPISWNSVPEQTPDGAFGKSWDYAAGVLTCLRPGLWEFDARAATRDVATTVFANTGWYLNGVAQEGTNGATSPAAFVSHGAPYRHTFVEGDTIEFRVFAGAATSAAVVDGGRQICWLTARLLEK